MAPHAEQTPNGVSHAEHDLFRSQFSKTKLCKFYVTNQCRYGDGCNFAHGSTTLTSSPDLKKTSICKEWRRGACPLNSVDCPFAHGRNELRWTEVYAQRADKIFMKPPRPSGPARAKPGSLEGHDSVGGAKTEPKPPTNAMYLLKAMLDNIKEQSNTEADPIDEISSVSTRSGSTPPTSEPAGAAADESQCYVGPSIMLCNLPHRYTKNMLTAEVKDMGFEIPRDIIYIHLPAAASSQVNYGHCLIAFSGQHPLDAFIDAFHHRVLRHFEEERKVVTVVRGPLADPGTENDDGLEDMQVIQLTEEGFDRLMWQDIPSLRQPSLKACPGCGCVHEFLGPYFCQWCGFSLKPAPGGKGVATPPGEQLLAGEMWQ